MPGRVLSTLLTTALFVVLMAPAAFAQAQVGEGDGGEGWWGETNDKVVTNFGFLLIAFFPLLVLILSLIQHRGEKKKDRQKAAAKARAARVDQRAGW